MDSYLIKSSRGGVSDYEDKGQEGSFKFGSSLDIRKKIDSISCQQALADDDPSAVVTGLVLFIVPASDGNTYLFDNTGKIYKRTSAAVYSVVYTDGGGQIRGAAEFGGYLYWATATVLHKKKISDSSSWSNVDADGGFPKALTSTTWHTMTMVNGSLLICNKDTIAFVSGDDGSYTDNALQLIPSNLAKCILERDKYAVIGASWSGDQQKTNMYLWDIIAQNYNDRRNIPASGVNAIIDTDLPLMQVGTDGELYYADTVNILPITRFPGGGYCDPDGVETNKGLALFGIFGADTGKNGVYSYGRRYKNHPISLNLEYPLTCDEIGSVRLVGSDLLISYKSGSTYGIKKVDSSTKATGTYESLDLLAPNKYVSRMPDWRMIKLLTKAMPASTSIACYFRCDKSSTWIQAKLEGGTTTFSTTGGTEAIFLVGAKGMFFEYKLELTPSSNNTPEVYKTWVYLE